MAKIKAKQIDALIGQASWYSGLIIPMDSTIDVSLDFIGRFPNGSDKVAGVFTASPHNKVYLRIASSGKLLSSNQFQIFARLTENNNLWTLTFLTLADGIEELFDFTTTLLVGRIIEYRWCESIQMSNYRSTAIVDLGNDVVTALTTGSAVSGTRITEVLSTGYAQTLFTLTNTPIKAEEVSLTVNGIKYMYGSLNDYSVLGNVLTWTNVFELEPTDVILCEYYI